MFFRLYWKTMFSPHPCCFWGKTKQMQSTAIIVLSLPLPLTQLYIIDRIITPTRLIKICSLIKMCQNVLFNCLYLSVFSRAQTQVREGSNTSILIQCNVLEENMYTVTLPHFLLLWRNITAFFFFKRFCFLQKKTITGGVLHDNVSHFNFWQNTFRRPWLLKNK